jgi:hypothetical protein
MKISLKNSTTLAALALAILLIPTISSQSEANGQRRHPAYLHALTDLRLARAYLDRLTPSERIDEDQRIAIREIDLAIHDIREAAIDDHKDLRDHAPVDAHIQPRNRFQKAHEALAAAMHDVDQEEDDPRVRGLKHRSMEHIRLANDTIRHIQERLHLL